MAVDRAWEEAESELQARARFTDDFLGEVYDEFGNLVVGPGYKKYSIEQRRAINARNLALLASDEFGNDALAIEIELYPVPENETVEQANSRKLQGRVQALDYAKRGEPDMAIVIGALPKPKVEPQPRMVDPDGKLIQEAVEIQF